MTNQAPVDEPLIAAHNRPDWQRISVSSVIIYGHTSQGNDDDDDDDDDHSQKQ
ncbi:hypothetical protein DPMN_088536 [Dreissena polymorpha]|uniref:Uncharacterized protein n=1 Tax=Dreissena polymorpha TaxID=45954 RepID=A0A9D4KW12_DREPO|nr:hypothetical protein DPMN_088536 [Dreissena polymorpha]